MNAKSEPDAVPLPAVVEQQTPCKCCGTTAALFGAVNFHKCCKRHQPQMRIATETPVHYYRCPECRFIFTTAFDHFSHEDFGRYIYNDEYQLIDPEYQEVRPRRTAAMLGHVFSDEKPERILDYGGGNGKLGELLRETGLINVDSYDPFVSGYQARPTGLYPCIVCFEVMEHAAHPRDTIEEMSKLLTEDGLILFSTMLQPFDIDQKGLNWWYVAPRNGHVSLYTRESLVRLVQPFGLEYWWLNEGMHVVARQFSGSVWKNMMKPQFWTSFSVQ